MKTLTIFNNPAEVYDHFGIKNFDDAMRLAYRPDRSTIYDLILGYRDFSRKFAEALRILSENDTTRNPNFHQRMEAEALAWFISRNEFPTGLSIDNCMTIIENWEFKLDIAKKCYASREAEVLAKAKQ